MYNTIQATNHLSFWKRFAAALIDGMILNISFEIILSIITYLIGDINLPSLSNNCELIFNLVYFAALDSLPKQVSVGKTVVENVLPLLKWW